MFLKICVKKRLLKTKTNSSHKKDHASKSFHWKDSSTNNEIYNSKANGNDTGNAAPTIPA